MYLYNNNMCDAKKKKNNNNIRMMDVCGRVRVCVRVKKINYLPMRFNLKNGYC